MKSDVIVLNEYEFLEEAGKAYKKEKIVVGSVKIGREGKLSFQYLPNFDSDPCVVCISPNFLLKCTIYQDYEVVFNTCRGKYELMVWRNV